MQPLHPKEARWFFEWGRLELVRGIGLSFFIIGIAFFIAFALGLFSTPPSYCARLSSFGMLLFLLSVCIDNMGRPHEMRRIRCRSCRSVFQMYAVMDNGWACNRCGTIGRFDNIE